VGRLPKRSESIPKGTIIKIPIALERVVIRLISKTVAPKSKIKRIPIAPVIVPKIIEINGIRYILINLGL
jgi:hypothetical protein